MKILSCQIVLPDIKTVSQRDTYLSDLIDRIAGQLDKEPADIVMLPELSSCGYPLQTMHLMIELAEDLSDTTVMAFKELAQKYNCAVCFGLPRRDDTTGDIKLSQIFISASGEVRFYDKLHLDLTQEAKYFSHGDHLFVTEMAGIRIGIIICYDCRFPELSRKLAIDHDIDLMLHATAFYKDDTYKSWKDFITTRALENEIYWLSQNYGGSDFGGTMLCPPDLKEGREIIRLSDEEQFHIFTLNTDLMKRKRQAKGYKYCRHPNYDDLTA